MDWIGGAVEAASAGHDVVMSPTEYCYLDYYQSTNHATEPKAIGGYLPLSKVYSFEPIPAKLDPQYQPHILGAQGNLWTEYIPNFKHAQYHGRSRACARWPRSPGRPRPRATGRISRGACRPSFSASTSSASITARALPSASASERSGRARPSSAGGGSSGRCGGGA